jgi:hypothetical protein
MTKTELKEPYDLTDDEAKDFCLKHWDAEICPGETMREYYDTWVYEETSADGYTIWIAKNEDGKCYPSESVYYYNDGLDEPIFDCLRHGGTLRISDDDREELSHVFDWQEKYAAIYEELTNEDEEE